MTRAVRRPSPAHAIVLTLAVSTFCMGAEAQTVFSSSGTNAAAISGSLTDFRNTLGTLNPNVAGSFASGRREINWDGVPDAFSAPNNLPANFFNLNSPRGVVFATPGTGFQVSANAASGTPVEFGNIDPAYPGLFAAFSAPRLFTALGSTVTDVNFFVPGSTQAALTRGFGVVFSDVDLAQTSSLTFFDASNQSLGTFFVSAVPGVNESFSFLGVAFGSASVARVRITSGNQVLAAGNTQEDLVVMDDFIYGEPVLALAAIPEPQTYALMLTGLGVVAWAGRRRRSARA